MTRFRQNAATAALCALLAMTQKAWAQPMANPVPTDTLLWKTVSAPRAGWGSTDVRYAKEKPAAMQSGTMTLSAWQGERVSAMAVLSTPVGLDSVTVSTSTLVSGHDSIPSAMLKPSFVAYVMTDGLAPGNAGGCGHRKSADYDSSLVADMIDTGTHAIRIEPLTTQSCWLSIDIPRGIKHGQYEGTVTISAAGKSIATLPLRVKVSQRILPPASQWAFHLDLWQNPYAVARYYNVEPFSAQHFELMRPIMQHYADAGGKVITASITHKPWNGQTYDPFESMVTWVKRADGTWLYDYTTFDRWVEFMMGLGVKKQINCYSMVPWRLSFQYLDGATNTMRFISCKPGEEAYDEFWGTMLKDFARHLREKGWFEMTHIAMDERSLPDMLATLKTIRRADPGFHVSLAGTLHDELTGELDDYCITLAEKLPDEVLHQRHDEGKASTFYTCCQEREPNTFTFSPPAEAEWLAWHCASEGLDGYLRWALNSWVRDPVHDSRFTAWPAGDTYLLYPDGNTSVRMERLREGIQQFEKVRILRSQLPASKQKRLQDALRPFSDFYSMPCTEAIRNARKIINSL